MIKLPRDIMHKIDSTNLRVDDMFKNDLKNKLLTMENRDMKKAQNSKMQNIAKLFKYNFASIVLAVATLAVVGGASAMVSSQRTKQAALRETTIPENLSNVLSLDEIRQKALVDVPGGVITGIELEQEDEGLIYKVKFADGSIRLYNAISGDAVVSRSDDFETDASVPVNFVAGISLQQARDIAQAQRPGKTIEKIELETENGVVVYSVRFTDDGRVDVNANNGSIVRLRSGDDDDNDNVDVEDNSDSSSSDDNDRDDDNSGSGSSNSGSGRSGRSGGSDD